MYEFVDHPSEAMVRVTANTINGVFEDAASALFELMTDTDQVKSERELKVELVSEDKALLLIDWLNRLIWIHEVENIFLCDFAANVFLCDSVADVQTGWKLEARVQGESVKPQQEKRLHAKSATYGQLQWKETTRGHEVQFVIDI